MRKFNLLIIVLLISVNLFIVSFNSANATEATFLATPEKTVKPIIKIGVLAKRGEDDSVKMWQPTADYLTEEISEYTFHIVPLNFSEIYHAVAQGEVDFIIANSGMYVEFESRFAVNRIATLRNLRINKSYTVFGGVILRKSSRVDIQTLSDFKNKTFMAVDETSMGGWRAVWREFQSVRINPRTDFKSLSFGGTHDAVVYAVRDGLVDGGTVRTDTLERMSAEGKINLEDFSIINPQNQYVEDFPFLLSTRLYPEWPFATLKHTPTLLAKKVAIALLKMPDNSPAARASKSEGWTIPLNYETVHQCFKELRVPPYENFGEITLVDLVQHYLYWVVAIIGSFFVLAVTTIFFQQRAIAQRRRVEQVLRQSEAQSKNYAQQLEVAVTERTTELAQANAEITVLNNLLRAENLRMSSELEVTRRLQQMILPKQEELNRIENLEIVGFMEPANEVGGDYYDVLQHDGRIKIGIGDVTGHGLESGVLMLMVQTAVRTLLANNVTDAETFFRVLNYTIYNNLKRMNSDKSLTLSLLDYNNGIVHLSGQHEEILIIRKGGIVERVDTFNLGFMVGLEADISRFVARLEVLLRPGDGVVLYTDGITEAVNQEQEMYGIERLCQALSRYWDKYSVKQIQQAVITDLHQHIKEQHLHDDITLLIIKQK